MVPPNPVTWTPGSATCVTLSVQHPPALCAPMSSFYGSLCSASNVNWQHGATRICCCVPCCLAPAVQHSISPANWAHSSKPATAVCSGWMTGWTDKRTDARPLHRPCSAYYVGSANENASLETTTFFFLWKYNWHSFQIHCMLGRSTKMHLWFGSVFCRLVALLSPNQQH